MAEREPQQLPSDHELAGPLSGISSFDRRRATIGLALGPRLLVILLLTPFPGLSTEAHRLVAVAALIITFWVTEAIPLPATALLGMVLIVVFGSGEIRITDMIRAGFLLNVIGIVVVWVTVLWWVPFVLDLI